MAYWVDFSEGGQVRDTDHNMVASFSFINTRVGGRKDPDAVKAHADLTADALNVHEATGLTPSQLQARVAELEAALSRVQKLTEWEAPDADSGAALNFNQGYESALEDVAAALKP